ncbi:MAG: MATE family efflux transporter [Oscillospiraceae bacterium]|nr:MATE family efflux transporter [Oscillospiraceae bacterium]
MEDNGNFVRSLFRRQAVLSILALLASTVGPIVCVAIAGVLYKSEGLAITAICSPLFFLSLFFAYIIAGGAQILSSRFIARDELESINGVFTAAIILTLIADIVVCGLLFVLKTPFLKFAAGEITPELDLFYNYFLLNAFVSMLIGIPLFFSKIAARPQIGLILTLTMSAGSIVFTLFFTGFMGIEAIALGQAIGGAIAVAVSALMLAKHFKIVVPKKLYIKKIFTLGSPLGMSRFYIVASTLVINAILAKLGGNDALAVFGVILMLNRFVTAFTIGTGQTLLPLISLFHEEQDNTSVKQTVKTAFLYSNIIMLIITALFCIFGTQIGQLFGLGENVIMFAQAMPFYGIYALLLINTTIFSSYYNASKKLLFANIINLLQEFALLCAFAGLLSIPYGIFGVWAAFPVSGIFTLLIIHVILTRIKLKNKDLSFPLLLNQRLEKQGKYISLSVEGNVQKACEAAQKIGEFCEENSLSSEKVMLISLSIEEMITLIINNNKKKISSIAVRLFLLDDIIILRIRNTGVTFDAIKYYNENIADDIEKSLDVIGLKYITENASTVFYRQTFGMNSLVVIL